MVCLESCPPVGSVDEASSVVLHCHMYIASRIFFANKDSGTLLINRFIAHDCWSEGVENVISFGISFASVVRNVRHCNADSLAIFVLSGLVWVWLITFACKPLNTLAWDKLSCEIGGSIKISAKVEFDCFKSIVRVMDIFRIRKEIVLVGEERHYSVHITRKYLRFW